MLSSSSSSSRLSRRRLAGGEEENSIVGKGSPRQETLRSGVDVVLGREKSLESQEAREAGGQKEPKAAWFGGRRLGMGKESALDRRTRGINHE